MIDRNDLRKIAHERLKDAEAMLAAGRYDAAVYLGGYVVELALKNRICKTLKWQAFPHSRKEFQNYQSFKIHDLVVLLSLSGAEDRVKTKYLGDWSAVEDWNPEVRYNLTGSVSQAKAAEFVEAARKLLRVL